MFMTIIPTHFVAKNIKMTKITKVTCAAIVDRNDNSAPWPKIVSVEEETWADIQYFQRSSVSQRDCWEYKNSSVMEFTGTTSDGECRRFIALRRVIEEGLLPAAHVWYKVGEPNDILKELL